MNKQDKTETLINNFFFKILLILIFTAFSGNLNAAVIYDTWGISKDKVIKKYIPSGDTTEFTLDKKPDYDNKIVNWVKSILKNVESDVDKEITVINSKSAPGYDYLLFRNKLFSVMELYNSISKDELNKRVKKLSQEYGEHSFNSDEGMEVYVISSKTTRITIHYYLKTKKCEIYYYDILLFHKLFTNEY